MVRNSVNFTFTRGPSQAVLNCSAQKARTELWKPIYPPRARPSSPLEHRDACLAMGFLDAEIFGKQENIFMLFIHQYFLNPLKKRTSFWPGMVTHTFNPSTWEAEAGRSLWVRGQHSLQSKFQDRLQSYRETQFQKTKTNQTSKQKTHNWWYALVGEFPSPLYTVYGLANLVSCFCDWFV